MRFNSDEVKLWAQKRTADKEGYLLYKSPKEDYRQRWFRLLGNLLLYYKSDSSLGDPLGVIVVEECEVKLEPPTEHPFLFSLQFPTDQGRKHLFSGRSEQYCKDWVEAVKLSSYRMLQQQLSSVYEELSKKSAKTNLSISAAEKKIPPHLLRKQNSKEVSKRYTVEVTNPASKLIAETTFDQGVSHDPFNVASKHLIDRSRSPKLNPADQRTQSLNLQQNLIEQALPPAREAPKFNSTQEKPESNIDLLRDLFATPASSSSSSNRPHSVDVPQRSVFPPQHSQTLQPPQHSQTLQPGYQTQSQWYIPRPHNVSTGGVYNVNTGGIQQPIASNFAHQASNVMQRNATVTGKTHSFQGSAPPTNNTKNSSAPKTHDKSNSTFYTNWVTFD